jgi:propanol-preferring alcohol dehydrogenase
MQVWAVDQPGPIDDAPLISLERSIPAPGPKQVRVTVSACGVCRTDLHLAEGDLSPKRAHVVPGHEIVGRIDACGDGASRFAVGDRIGIAWLRRTCGRCRWCRRGQENLCLNPAFTGWDEDGGYAPYAVADEAYAYPLPEKYDDKHAAPLLCAGIIGYRALRLANLPPAGRLGIYGFGASAHLAAQIALHQGARVHVMTRSVDAQRLALALGVDSATGAADPPPESLDAAILFAPAGSLVPACLAALDRGGTLAIAGIHLSDIPVLNYASHLFEERVLRSVTANTRRDGEEFLALATRLDLTIETTPYPMSKANQALADLAHDRVNGAAVLLAE